MKRSSRIWLEIVDEIKVLSLKWSLSRLKGSPWLFYEWSWDPGEWLKRSRAAADQWSVWMSFFWFWGLLEVVAAFCRLNCWCCSAFLASPRGFVCFSMVAVWFWATCVRSNFVCFSCRVAYLAVIIVKNTNWYNQKPTVYLNIIDFYEPSIHNSSKLGNNFLHSLARYCIQIYFWYYENSPRLTFNHSGYWNGQDLAWDFVF